MIVAEQKRNLVEEKQCNGYQEEQVLNMPQTCITLYQTQVAFICITYRESLKEGIFARFGCEVWEEIKSVDIGNCV